MTSLAEKIANDTIQNTMYVPMNTDYSKSMESRNNRLNYLNKEMKPYELRELEKEIKIGYDMDKDAMKEMNRYFRNPASLLYSQN